MNLFSMKKRVKQVYPFSNTQNVGANFRSFLCFYFEMSSGLINDVPYTWKTYLLNTVKPSKTSQNRLLDCMLDDSMFSNPNCPRWG